MRIFRADLHIHTILSPCGNYGMTPVEIVDKALEKGLDVIAVTDHNSAGNAAAVAEAAEGKGLTVIGGMEITTEEEVHVLGYFGNFADLASAEKVIHEYLNGINNPEVFGDQVFLDSQDRITGICEKLLTASVSMDISSVVQLIRSFSGIAVAAHIDRESFSIISQLGYIPEGLELDAVEMYGRPETEDGLYSGFPVIRSSDAHSAGEIGGRVTEFHLEKPELEEIRMALQGINGRKVCL